MRRFLEAVMLILIVVLIAGCSARREQPPRHQLEPQPSPTLRVMPEVRGSGLETAGLALQRGGLNVKVLIPERRFVAPAKDRGSYGSSPATTVVLPGSTRPFDPPEWPFTVAAQQPPAGVVLSEGQTVTLTAGPHLGSVALKPWANDHPEVIKKQGAQPCFQCHDPVYCPDCHTKWL